MIPVIAALSLGMAIASEDKPEPWWMTSNNPARILFALKLGGEDRRDFVQLCLQRALLHAHKALAIYESLAEKNEKILDSFKKAIRVALDPNRWNEATDIANEPSLKYSCIQR